VPHTGNGKSIFILVVQLNVLDICTHVTIRTRCLSTIDSLQWFTGISVTFSLQRQTSSDINHYKLSIVEGHRVREDKLEFSCRSADDRLKSKSQQDYLSVEGRPPAKTMHGHDATLTLKRWPWYTNTTWTLWNVHAYQKGGIFKRTYFKCICCWYLVHIVDPCFCPCRRRTAAFSVSTVSYASSR